MSWEPITGICIVEDRARAPPGFEVISLTTDNCDADLWKDKKMRKKITRYLAFTRIKTELTDRVLGDITVMKDDVPTPPGYTCVTHTIDTKEVVLKKKCLVVRLVDRKDTNEAIMDIYITSGKSKSKPVESTARSWEIKDLALFLRYGPVVQAPASNGPKPADLPYQFPVRQNSAPFTNMQSPPSSSVPVTSPLYHRPTLTRQSTMRSPEHKAHMSGIDGVPFVLNPMLLAVADPNRVFVPPLDLKTREEILRMYEYDFSTEKSVKRQAALTS